MKKIIKAWPALQDLVVRISHPEQPDFMLNRKLAINFYQNIENTAAFVLPNSLATQSVTISDSIDED